MKRTFIAFKINPSSKLMEEYDLLRHRLRAEKINWVLPEKLHITVKFMGDTENEKIPQMAVAIKRKLSAHRPFEIVLAGAGVFKNMHDPRVIWLGSNPCHQLQQVKMEIDEALAEFGFRTEQRAFVPHLTLGRIKMMRSHDQLAQWISRNKETIFQQQHVDEMLFLESMLTPQGPEYLELYKLRLDKAAL
jgi:2'-5' RNA ligase